MRKIYANLWDDYKQIPTYDHNDPTAITLEKVEEFKRHQIQIIRGLVMDECLDWKAKNGKKEVNFKIDDENDNRIVVTELDEKSRKELFKYLNKSNIDYSDVKITWLMES